VLIVDDDVDALEEYCETATGLGYGCCGAADPASALQALAEDQRIGIVVTDLQMPKMDGLAFLDELSSRFSPLRPLVSIVITGHGSLESAVLAMRFSAKDFLTKPVSSEGFAAALRRASRAWNELYVSRRLATLAQQNNPSSAETQAVALPPVSPEAEREEMLAQVRGIVRMREKRADFLDPQLFSDPTWDILLDLTAARLEDKPVPVSSVCVATNVPLTTALRYVRSMVEAGLIRRWKDTKDRRRDLLELEDQTMVAMTKYLADVRRRMPAGG
jgi:FixJ family two-component response regulator